MIIGKTWRKDGTLIQIRTNVFAETWVLTRTGFSKRLQLAHTDAQAVAIFKSEIARLGGSDIEITE